jgi:hypothetical protein
VEYKGMDREDIEELVSIRAIKLLLQMQGLDINEDELREIIVKKRIELHKEPTFNDIMSEIKKLNPNMEFLKNNNKNSEERIIRANELESYLKKGWSYVDQLSDGRIVVKRANSI